MQEFESEIISKFESPQKEIMTGKPEIVEVKERILGLEFREKGDRFGVGNLQYNPELYGGVFFETRSGNIYYLGPGHDERGSRRPDMILLTSAKHRASQLLNRKSSAFVGLDNTEIPRLVLEVGKVFHWSGGNTTPVVRITSVENVIRVSDPKIWGAEHKRTDIRDKFLRMSGQ